MKITRSATELTITMPLPEVEVDDQDLISEIESVIEDAVKLGWQNTLHAHQPKFPKVAGAAMSSCKLCGRMEDMPPHTH